MASYDRGQRFYVLDLGQAVLYAERYLTADRAASAAYGLSMATREPGAPGPCMVVYDYTESRRFRVGEQVTLTPTLTATVQRSPFREAAHG